MSDDAPSLDLRPSSWLRSGLDATGDRLAGLGRWGYFVARVVRAFGSGWATVAAVLEQMVAIGVRSLPVVAAVGAFVGTTTVMVGYVTFHKLGTEEMVGAQAGMSLIREMCPLLVGTMMAAKPGTEITAMLATMRVREQIDALEVMAVNPYGFLLVPRVLAFILVAPALIVITDFLAVAAGYLVAVYQFGISGGAFMANLLTYVGFRDLQVGIIKVLIFAVVTCLISAYFGYHSKPGPAGVSRAINKSMVTVATVISVGNYFLSQFFYG